MTAAPGEPAAPRAVTPEQAARLPYRRGVGIMLLNREGKVFVAQRLDTPGAAWQMPQGGIDESESPREAALRELREEVGASRVEVLAESPDWVRYDLPVDLVPLTWCGRYRGQEQKWFVLRFLGTDDDIDITAETAEFSAWRWVDVRDLPDLIVPFKRPVYRALVKAFGHLARPTDGT